MKIFSLCITAAFFLCANVHSAELVHRPVFGGLKPHKIIVLVVTTERANVSVLYSAYADMTGAIETSTYTTKEKNGFSKTIKIKNLRPDTAYFVDVRVDGERQLLPPYPSFTTFTSQRRREFNVAILNDFINPNKQTVEFDTFLNASLENPAFVLIGGDFVHRNFSSVDGRRNMIKDAYTGGTPGLSDFRNLILDQYGIVHQWDDHGIPDNNQNRLYKPNGEMADWDISRNVYNTTIPHYWLRHPVSIYHKFKYGQAEFFVLDTRSARDPESQVDDENKTMLGVEQLDWLLDNLLISKATWKVIFSSVSINATISKEDSWKLFQTEWQEILGFIGENDIQGVVVVSGDIHMGAIDDGTAAGLPTMSVPPANLEPKTGNCSTTGKDKGEWSHGTYVTFRDDATGTLNPCNGYGVLEFLTNPDRLTLFVKDDKGWVRNSYQLRYD